MQGSRWGVRVVVLAAGIVGLAASCGWAEWPLLLGQAFGDQPQEATVRKVVREQSGTDGKSEKREFLIIGHRGAPAVFPGNTIESCREALRQGANALEVDLCLTRDNRIVLWHDARHTSAVAATRQLGLEPVVRYRPWVPNVGSPLRCEVHNLYLSTFRRNYGYTEVHTDTIFQRIESLLRVLVLPAERAPYAIPTLEEFVAWARGQKNLKRVFLDVKVPKSPSSLALRFARRAREVLTRHGYGGRCVFLTTERSILKVLQRQVAATGAGFSYDQEILDPGANPADYSAVAAAKAEVCLWASIGKPHICIEPWIVYRTIVRRDLARRGPIRFIAWTINDAGQMRTLIRMGVDGIMTDRPAVLAAVVASETRQR